MGESGDQIGVPNQPGRGFAESTRVPGMTFGQILDRIFCLIRTRAKLLLGIAMIPAGSFLVLYALLVGAMLLAVSRFQPHKQPDLNQVNWIVLPTFLVGGLPVLAAYALYQAAASYAATQADLGVTVSVRESYTVAWRHAGRYIWLLVLRWLYSFFPFFAAAAVIGAGESLAGFGTGASPGNTFVLFAVLVLLYLGWFVYVIFITLRMSLAVPACVCEGISARDAIRRSARLTRGAKGRIFLVALIVYVLGYVLEIVMFIILAIVFGIGTLTITLLHVQLLPAVSAVLFGLMFIAILAAMSLWLAVFLGGFSTAFAVLYGDQRLRVDGFVTALPPPGSGT